MPIVASEARPPPPLVTAPMVGEPASLDEVRLVSRTCGDEDKLTEALVAQMKKEVDAERDAWKEAQPSCWEARRQVARNMPMWGASVGDAFGAGGLGLSGIGEGGGGSRDEAIGLGSFGTIGHGSGSKEPAKATSTSKTNNQVEGVDEADLVKTDGTYLYLASNGALRIIEALNPRVVSVTELGDGVRELFVEGDTAVVYTSKGAHGKPCTYGYDCNFAGDGSSTVISILDISNRAAPKVVRTIALSGSLMAARRIGRTVHTVVADGDTAPAQYETYPDIDTCTTDWHIVYEKFAALKVENEKRIRQRANTSFPTMTDNGVTTKLCSGYRTKLDDGRATTSVVSFSLDDREAPTVSTLKSRPGAVFASADALYLAVRHARPPNAKSAGGNWYASYASVDEVSEIHKFKIGAHPEDTGYVGSGAVTGHVLNQFAMDEWFGYLRVATTRGKVPNPDVSSSISILRDGPDKNLARVGAVDNIAPGEDIRAVRFDGDRAYVVTFKKTDPLFVVDLYQPNAPAILGELKIPGFSTYLHRLDAGHLLSIGFDADDHGSFAYFNGVILQLFDVTSPTDPKLLFKEKIGSRGSSSEAATNHLAFNYFAEKHLLALPMTICEGGGDGQYGDKLTFSGLVVYDVSLDGFKKLGGVAHSKEGVSCQTWWSNASSAVQRSVFVDDLVYSIAGDRAKVQRMGKLGVDVADLSLTSP
ncbi:MAG: beta-propeller domain-containing protein [Polyangiaceae bacterium]